jgi:hypothetical protein
MQSFTNCSALRLLLAVSTSAFAACKAVVSSSSIVEALHRKPLAKILITLVVVIEVVVVQQAIKYKNHSEQH